MKRDIFILIFVALVFSILTPAIHSDKITTLGCGGDTSSESSNSASSSNSNCYFKNQNPPSDNVLTFAYPTEVLAIKATAASMGINTDNIPTSFKLHVSASNPSFASIDGGTPPALTPKRIAQTQGECTLYTFTRRIQFSGTYSATFDHKAADPTTGQETCYYKAIAGNLIQGFTDCPEFPKGVTNQNCPPAHQCSYRFDKTYTYGYIVVGDKEGCNPLVTPIQQYDSEQAIAQGISAAATLCKAVDNSQEGKCGDGKLDAGEECDAGTGNGGNKDNRRCTSTCKFNICGDGKIFNDPLISDPPDSNRDKEEQKYEECDDGNRVDGDGCSKDCRNENLCDKETQFACYSQFEDMDTGQKKRGGAGWCCDKWIGNCIPQECSLSREKCTTGMIKPDNLLTQDYGIKWLDPTKPFPSECSCSDTTLLIIGDVISTGQGNSRELFSGYSLSKYCSLKERFGDRCIFAMTATNWADFVDKIANFALRNNHNLKIAKNLFVITHGSPQGTAISEYGDTFGSLVCKDGKADMLSCLVGSKPIAGLIGTPQLVQQFCNNAAVGTQTRVSESVILVSRADLSPFWDQIVKNSNVCTLNNPDCGIYQTAGNYHCYECTGVGTAREVQCTGFD